MHESRSRNQDCYPSRQGWAPGISYHTMSYFCQTFSWRGEECVCKIRRQIWFCICANYGTPNSHTLNSQNFSNPRKLKKGNYVPKFQENLQFSPLNLNLKIFQPEMYRAARPRKLNPRNLTLKPRSSGQPYVKRIKHFHKLKSRSKDL